jgi:hypothetical protein
MTRTSEKYLLSFPFWRSIGPTASVLCTRRAHMTYTTAQHWPQIYARTASLVSSVGQVEAREPGRDLLFHAIGSERVARAITNGTRSSCASVTPAYAAARLWRPVDSAMARVLRVKLSLLSDEPGSRASPTEAVAAGVAYPPRPGPALARGPPRVLPADCPNDPVVCAPPSGR